MNAAIFQDAFFSQNMHQIFNLRVTDFRSDETESALRKWLRASGKL